MRMLTPRELFRCQGFPETYQIEGGRDVCNAQGSFLQIAGEWIELTKSEQIRMCGNSVSPPPCRALIEANFRGGKPAEHRHTELQVQPILQSICADDGVPRPWHKSN